MNMRTKCGVLAASVSTILCASAAQAAEPPVEDQSVEEVVVTGSRIARRNLDAPTPVTELSGAEITGGSSVSVGDVLNDLPAMRGTFTSANSTRFIGTAGVNFLDLRGLGSERTLVLVNGRRHVSGTDGSLQVDTNTIPADLLERVDVVTGGASSIYGSDAVAGVVNFVLKKNFEGVRVSGQHGISGESDNANSFFSVTGGLNFMDGRGNVAGSVEWAREDSFKMMDREETARREIFVVSSQDPPGTNSDGIPDRTLVADTRSLYIFEGGAFIPALQPGITAGNRPANTLRPENSQPRVWQFAPDGSLAEMAYGQDFRPFATSANGGSGTTLRRYGDLTPEIERAAVNLLGSFEIVEAAELFAEAKYVQTDTLSESSPSFNQTVNTLAPASIGSGALTMRLDNPYLTTQARSAITPLLRPGVTTFNLNRNNLDLGIRGEDTTRETSRFVAGLRGQVTDSLSYEVSLNYGRLKVNTDVLGNRYERQLRLAADAARAADGTIVCRSRLNGAGAIITTGDLVIDGCQPVNLFGDGAVSDAARGYITAPSTFEAKVQQEVASGFVSYDTGSWFELPGGGIGLALGAEYRKESSESAYSDDVTQGLTFLNAIQPMDEEYSVKEAFVEVQFPILREMPFAEDLTLSGGFRAADYSLENTDTVTAWNGSLQWAPVEDVRFRAGLSQAVRAPTLSELFQPQTQNFATVRDPCDVNFISQGRPTRAANCAAAGVPAGFVNSVARAQTIEIRSGGNSGLTEEQARSFTVGTVIQPRWTPGLAISVDYYEIEIEDVIASVTAQQILDNCYDGESLNNIFCPLVFRDPATSLFYANGNGPIGGGVLQSTLNYASRKARGIDTEVSYSYDAGTVGTFDVRLLGTYVRQRDNFPFVDQPNQADQLTEELGDPKYAANGDLRYRRGNLELNYGVRWLETQYVDFIENIRWVTGQAPTNPDFSDVAWTGSVMYHDLRAGYTFNDSIDVYVGIDNVTDKMPPIGLTGTGAGSGIYDNTGRFFYGGVKWSFGGVN